MCVGVPQVLLYSIMFTLRTSVLPPLSAVGAIVAILTDNGGESLTGGAVGGGQTTRTVTTVYYLHSDLRYLYCVEMEYTDSS